jgi:hypothetical protein
MPKAPIFPILLCLLALPIPGLQAQEALTVRVIPRFGLLSPDTYFYEKFKNFADDEPEEWTNGSLGRAAYVAVALEAGLEERGISLRGELGRTFEGWLSVSHNYVRPRVLFEPKEIITTWLDVPAALTFATAQIVLPTRFEAWGIQPYFFVGGGGKWYHFDDPTEENTVEAILPSDGFTANLDVGGGFAFTLWGQDLDVQIRDTFNRYWGKYQHDLVFSGAWVWTVR